MVLNDFNSLWVNKLYLTALFNLSMIYSLTLLCAFSCIEALSLSNLLCSWSQDETQYFNEGLWIIEGRWIIAILLIGKKREHFWYHPSKSSLCFVQSHYYLVFKIRWPELSMEIQVGLIWGSVFYLVLLTSMEHVVCFYFMFDF